MSKLHILLIAGVVIAIIGFIMLGDSAKNCDQVTYTKGTQEITYDCPLETSELFSVTMSRTNIFMLEKVLVGFGLALILIWAISFVSIKYGSKMNIEQ